MNLQGKHALVCGASQGIGRATALALAAEGASITALARTETALESLLPELLAKGAPAVRALVADADDRPALFAKIELLLRESGPVHILVNNTGGPKAGPILEATEEEFLAAFSRHVLVSHGLVTRVLPGMRGAGYGRIVNVVSTSVKEPIAGLGVSNTTRGAMASWAKTVSKELPPGITINNVLPGYTATERLTALKDSMSARSGKSGDEIEAEWLRSIPEGRLADPSETAAAIAFLASPAGAYIRGVSLAVDGGRLQSI